MSGRVSASRASQLERRWALSEQPLDDGQLSQVPDPCDGSIQAWSYRISSARCYPERRCLRPPSLRDAVRIEVAPVGFPQGTSRLRPLTGTTGSVVLHKTCRILMTLVNRSEHSMHEDCPDRPFERSRSATGGGLLEYQCSTATIRCIFRRPEWNKLLPWSSARTLSLLCSKPHAWPLENSWHHHLNASADLLILSK